MKLPHGATIGFFALITYPFIGKYLDFTKTEGLVEFFFLVGFTAGSTYTGIYNNIKREEERELDRQIALQNKEKEQP